MGCVERGAAVAARTPNGLITLTVYPRCGGGSAHALLTAEEAGDLIAVLQALTEPTLSRGDT
jgi:hypothetical protein